MEFYHEFSALGISTLQKGGIYPPNQRAKAPIITGYLIFAIGKLKVRGVSPLTTAELFCADAYYSFVASRFGADACIAIDNDRDGHLQEARAAKALLCDERVEIRRGDVMEADLTARIVLNTGGLYHVNNPLVVLERSYAMATDYLIVQSVVSLADLSPTYCEMPAPGWTWGCRFSPTFLDMEMHSRGWKVIDREQNELTGNDRREDRGSVYYLIEKPRD